MVIGVYGQGDRHDGSGVDQYLSNTVYGYRCVHAGRPPRWLQSRPAPDLYRECMVIGVYGQVDCNDGCGVDQTHIL